MSIDLTEPSDYAPRPPYPEPPHSLDNGIAASPTLELLAPHINLIVTVVAVIFYPDYRPEFEVWLVTLARRYPGPLLAAIQRILDGERDADALCKTLDQAGAAVARCIARGIENPAALKPYLAGHPEYASRFRLRKKT